MSKSKNTKNEQQKDLCITSEQLTEQWKKGELINGKKYYITFFDSEPFEATFRYYEAMIPYWKFEANGKQYCNENGYDCVKVLAEVPSYDELQNMNKAVNECMAANIKLVEQNKQLKGLLKRSNVLLGMSSKCLCCLLSCSTQTQKKDTYERNRRNRKITTEYFKGVLGMIERISKMLLSIVVLPFILLILCLIACFMITMPVIALIRPDVIKLGEE